MRRLTRVALFAMVVALLPACVCYAAECCSAGTTCAVAIAAKNPDNVLTAQEKSAGWRLLFDGKTLANWACQDRSSKGWFVDHGVLTLDPKLGGGYLYTDDQFGDFELAIDFKVSKDANSGVWLRWADVSDPVQTGIEMQILDSANNNPPNKWDCGAIYDCLAPSENAMKPAMEWNTAVIRCSKNYITVTLNNKRIIVMNLNKWPEAHKNPDGSENKFDTAYKDMPKRGHIGLQDHGYKLWFRNIKVRDLS